MKHTTKSSKNKNSNSSSPRSRSRSREKELQQEKEKSHQNHPHEKNKNSRQAAIQKPDQGKLYLANIPLSLPQQKIIQEFEKYGKILDYSFRKKTDVPHPYYYGHITLCKKNEAEQAMKNIVNKHNWTVKPFEKENKDKNSNKDKNNLNNLNYNLINNINNIKSSNEDKSQNDESNNFHLNNHINTSNIKVREILVSNLPLSIIEKDLYKEFFIFGEISKIELKTIGDKKIAFIKYRLINSAMKALEKEKNINFSGNLIDVNFSNINQRKDIKGNELNYELNETNCKLIVVCLNKNIDTISEENALKIFENYGDIKNIIIKNFNSRNHIFVEYYKPEDAKRAIDKLNIDIETKKLFGDENCEINFYFKNKFNEINPCLNEVNNNSDINMNINSLPSALNNNINMNNNTNNLMNNNIPKLLNQNNNIGMNNMNNPALLFQLMQKQNLLNINNKPNNNQINDINQINQINQLNNLNIKNNLINNINNNNPFSKVPFTYNRLLYPNPNNFPFANNPQFFNSNNSNIANLNNLQMLQNLLNNSNQINLNSLTNNNIMNNMNNNTNNNANNNDNRSNNEVKDILNQILSDKNNQKNNNSNSESDLSSINGSHQSAEEMEFEKEYSLEAEDLKIIWNGFLTKNGKDRTNVDMFKIRGNIDDSYIKEYALNICNRIQFEEVLKKRELGLVAISPNSITQKDNFDLFMNYLQDKQRCGVVNISDNKYTLFLVSPCEFSELFYVNPKKHLLGIMVENSSDQGRPPLSLPPPVYSLTAKRKLMGKNSKNENKKDIKDNHNNKQSDQEMIMKLKEELKKMENSGDEEGKKSVEEMIKQNPNIKDIFENL